jgi:penicillin-binding protein 1C
MVFEVTHRQKSGNIYWHLDGLYLGATNQTHHMALALKPGDHTIALVADSGDILERQFTIIGKH